MNGAIAEPWVKTTSRPSRASMTTIGPSHHFLRTLMKAHSSPTMPIFSNAIQLSSADTMMPPAQSVQLVETTPIHVLAQRGLLLLVEDDRHPGEAAELRDEVVIEGAFRPGDRLEPCRVVHVGHRGDDPLALPHLGHEQHVGTVAFDLEPVRGLVREHRRSEGPEALAELDLHVEGVAHLGVAGS